ncbi:peroxisomal biogenesis factor 19 [Orussus abietinus]|uniref:peroxisomal biogenesis factor 19 n=1 Tax=Orussus abietinus TaxID=222816 RepID=UPI00062689A6|nr:peroxisomal biogenesis factor 19 [Orussus abietinus]XP_012270921.1 peroxisomal biogenesis factor 19 [Orussus abietinus]
MTDKEKKPEQLEDPELNDLLDSALQDFDKVPKVEAKMKDEQATSLASAAEFFEGIPSFDDVCTDECTQEMKDRVMKYFEPMFTGVNTEEGCPFQKAVKTVTGALSNINEIGSSHAESTIAEALKELAAVSENTQTQPKGPNLSEADLSAMFGQISLDDGAGDVLPFMQGIMQSLLSKDVLHRPLSELVQRYPSWLEEKKDTLPPADLERYKKQLDLLLKICAELEKEKEDDSEAVKKQQFETKFTLMQEMHNCGQPPEDFFGDQAPLLQFDPQGNPILPSLPLGADPQQSCSIM